MRSTSLWRTCDTQEAARHAAGAQDGDGLHDPPHHRIVLLPLFEGLDVIGCTCAAGNRYDKKINLYCAGGVLKVPRDDSRSSWRRADELVRSANRYGKTLGIEEEGEHSYL